MKIVKSLIVIVAVLAIAAGATGAYFTDQETVPASFTAGKLDVELRGPNASGMTIALDTTQAFTGGMAPGVWFDPFEVQVYNKGWGQSTLPVKFAWTANYTGGIQAMYDKLNVKVREGNCDWLGQPWFTGGWLYDGALNAMPAHLQTAAGPLNPNITRCSWFYFQLDPTANNSLQGANTQFNLVLDATQPENPGWTQ